MIADTTIESTRRIECVETGQSFATVNALARHAGIKPKHARSALKRGVNIRGNTYIVHGTPIGEGTGVKAIAVMVVESGKQFASMRIASIELGISVSMIKYACEALTAVNGMHVQFVDEVRRKAAERAAEQRANDRNWKKPRDPKRRHPVVVRDQSKVEAVFLELSPSLEKLAGAYARRWAGLVDFDDLMGAANLGVVDAMSRQIHGRVNAFCMKTAAGFVKRAVHGGEVNRVYARRNKVPFNFKTFTRMSGGNVDFDYAATLGDATDEQADAFTDLIEPLAGVTRTVIKLHYFADMTFAEIAAHLGETVDVVERIHASALEELRKAHAAGTPGEERTTHSFVQ